MHTDDPTWRARSRTGSRGLYEHCALDYSLVWSICFGVTLFSQFRYCRDQMLSYSKSKCMLSRYCLAIKTPMLFLFIDILHALFRIVTSLLYLFQSVMVADHIR